MGGTKDMWIGEHEAIGDEYASGEIEREEATARLKALGFYPSEIKDQLDALEEDRNA
jgi:Holliday junction resolvasome RuvABC DNA-binding subunit